MHILKHGDPDRIKATRQFICLRCGCEFEADKNEYCKSHGYFEVCYFCECPECHEAVREVNRKDDS